MSNNKQSSIDFLIDNLYLKDSLKWKEIIEQAKAMHKEEIENAFNKGGEIGVDIGSNHDWHEGHNQGHQYYNEIFGGNNENL